MRLNKATCSLALVLLQSPVSVQAEWWTDCKQSWREGLRDIGGYKIFYEPAVCSCTLSCTERSVASRLREVVLPSTPLLWKPIQSTASTSGLPSTRSLLEHVQRRVRKMTKGLERLSCKDRPRELECSAWKREGSGETLLWFWNTVRGLLRKRDREAVFTRVCSERQGQMVSNWKKVGLD